MFGVSVPEVRRQGRAGGASGSAMIPLVAVGALSLAPGALSAQCGSGGGGGGAPTMTDARGSSRVEVRYDKAEDVSLVSVGPVGDAAGARWVQAAYECTGKAPCVPGAVQILLFAPPVEEAPEGGERLVFGLDDGTRIEAGDARYRTQAREAGEMLGVVMANLSSADFVRIARAKAAAYEFGAAKGALESRQIDALRGMARRIEKASKAN